MALGTIAAVGGIVGGGSRILGGRAAKKDADKLAREQEAAGREAADLIGLETEEELRRFDAQTEKAVSTGKALQAASGFGSGGSQDIYMDNMVEELQKERDWTEAVSKQRQAMAIRTGGLNADTSRSQGRSALYSGISSGIGSIFTGIGYL